MEEFEIKQRAFQEKVGNIAKHGYNVTKNETGWNIEVAK